ncbi:MAG: FN3 associated domain-containing protein, partial [Verrucomicrobiota bacterium]|nr:FN3 associated domain-containing protein [Verrucomicrobiota bacterium]
MKHLLLTAHFAFLLSITASAAKVKDTKFKHGRGFFSVPFEEVITSETPGATIICTLDGSDPRRSDNTVIGTSPLTVAIDPDNVTKRPKTPCVIVRAYAKKNGLDETNVDTQTYIFIESVKRQDSASPGGGWPVGDRINRQVMIYGMNQSVIND